MVGHDTIDGRWTFAHLAQYYDINTASARRNAAALGELPSADRTMALAAIGRAVAAHAASFDDAVLAKAAVSMADDLYLYGCSLVEWGQAQADYVAAVWGTFFDELAERGFSLRYLVENTWPDGLQRPLQLFPQLYQAAGLAYVCPHAMATVLPGAADAAPTLQGLAPFLTEGRLLAARALDVVVEHELSLMYLEADDDGSFATVRQWARGPRVVGAIRTEAGFPGTRIEVQLPTA